MIVEKEIFINAFPTSMTTDVNSLLEKLDLTTTFKSTECFQINYNGQVLSIPYRIYYDEPNQQNLTDKEIFLLDCIFTRHYDGYIREKKLKKILESDSYLTTPFVAQLLGEYVLEILTVIKDNLSQTHLNNLVRFTADNPTFFSTTKQRVQSYWNCYYKRTTPIKTDYIGFQILEAINNRKQEIRSISI